MDDLAAVCHKYRVRELSLFGSEVRSELYEDSDLDFLVEFAPQAHAGFLTLGGLSRELPELLRRPVDVVTKGGLKEAIRMQVLASSEVIFAT